MMFSPLTLSTNGSRHIKKVRYGWYGFTVADWYPPTGRTIHHPHPFPNGEVAAGVWLKFFKQHNTHPIHPISVVWTTDLLLKAVGAASPTTQDASPTLTGSTLQPGWFTPETTLLYRKHPQQATHGGMDRPTAAVSADARLLATRQASLWDTP